MTAGRSPAMTPSYRQILQSPGKYTDVKPYTYKTPIKPFMDQTIVASEIDELRDILCIRKPGMEGHQTFDQVMRKLNDIMEDHQQLTVMAFGAVII